MITVPHAVWTAKMHTFRIGTYAPHSMVVYLFLMGETDFENGGEGSKSSSSELNLQCNNYMHEVLCFHNMVRVVHTHTHTHTLHHHHPSQL